MSRSFLVGLLLLVPLAGAQDRPPNLILFYVDDLGWRDGGVLGSRYYETPHLDRMAAEGRLFTDAYANAPNCAPSRASLMTGLYTPRHGVYTVGSAARGKAADRKLTPPANRTELDEDFVTLAEALGRRGYATAAMGKWHLSPDPTTHGFDRNVGGTAKGHPKSYYSPYSNPALPDGPEGESLTARLTDEALEFVEEHRAEPFFLYLSHFGVHTPIQSTPELKRRFAAKDADGGHARPDYAGMIAEVDLSLGRLLARLSELELDEHTLVVFTSDNGGHGPVTSMAPLRGAKGMLYEGGLRVPFVARWPGHVAAGSRCDVPVIGSDLYPTFAALAGASREELDGLDGCDLAPLLEGGALEDDALEGGALEGGGPLEREALYWHFPAYLERTRGVEGPWRTTPAGAIRRGRYKLLEFFEDDHVELYDLAADLGETRDLSPERPELAASLRAELAAWRALVDAAMPE